MKGHSTLVTVLLSLNCAFFCAQSALSKDVKSELIRLDRQIAAAEERHDTAALKRLLADDFISTDQRGTMRDRAQVLQHIQSAKPMSHGSASTSDYEVRVLGNSAVMTHTTTLKSEDGKTEQLRATHVWAKRGGRWQLVSDSCIAVINGTQPVSPELPSFTAACSEVSFEPKVFQFYGDQERLVKDFDRDGMQLPERRAYMLLVETERAAELTFFERTGAGQLVNVSQWRGESAGDLREQLAALMLANKGVACIGRQTKAYVNARYTPRNIGDIPAPVTATSAFSHLVKHFGREYVRVTVFLLC